MPMTVSGMKNAMLVELNLDGVAGIDAETKAAIEDRIDCLARAIVGYIKSNAKVTTIVVGTCPSGGGPLTGGTGTGTIS